MGWTPDEDFYRFYLGRNDAGGLVAATVFLTEYTIHGPVRVAVALGPDGKVKVVRVVELTEETYPWVKPLIDQNFTQAYVGQDSRGRFALDPRVSGAGDAMTRRPSDGLGSVTILPPPPEDAGSGGVASPRREPCTASSSSRRRRAGSTTLCTRRRRSCMFAGVIGMYGTSRISRSVFTAPSIRHTLS